jgi:hypothetical protein
MRLKDGYDLDCEICCKRATHLMADIVRHKTHTKVEVFQALCGPCYREHEQIFRWVLEPLSGGRAVRGRIPEKRAVRE